jgi:hypothetical protein
MEGTPHPIQNYLIVRANRSKYLLIYLSPLIVLTILMVLQSWTEANFKWVNANPQENYLDPIPKCSGEGCLTLGVIYNGKK